MLGHVGVLPEMIERETKKEKRSGSNREDHKERAAELGDEFFALIEDILAHGIKESLKVVREGGGWAIADGRNRWEAARYLRDAKPLAPIWDGKRDLLKKRQSELAKGIPCVEITEGEVPAVILSAMTRRHMTKQARALMAVKVFPEVAESGAGRKSRNDCGITQPELATRVGVSLKTLEDACLFWRMLKTKSASVAEAMMQSVFAGVSFKAIETGEKGKAAVTKEGKRPKDKVWALMARNCGSMMKQWKAFDGLKPNDRIDIIERLSATLTSAPDDVRTAIKTALENSGT